MIANQDPRSLIGAEVLDAQDEKVGKVGQIYVEEGGKRPTWASIRTGLFGKSETFVPLDRADWAADALHVPFDKAKIKDAPRIDPDGELSPDDQQKLYDYYSDGPRDGDRDRSQDRDRRDDHSRDQVGTGERAEAGGGDADGSRRGADDDGRVDVPGDREASRDDERTAAASSTGARDDSAPVGHDTSGPTTDDAMTRSEERVHVGTERVVAGRARLKKYIVTEEQTVTVPVQREEVRLEREPITDANAGSAMAGPALSEEEHEVTLTEERPVVAKETVPVERVRLDTDTVTENEQVTENVRKEQIDLDADRP